MFTPLNTPKKTSFTPLGSNPLDGFQTIAQPSLVKDIAGGIKDNASSIVNSVKDSASGNVNPFVAGASIAKNVTEAVLQPLNQTIGKVTGKVLNPAVQAISDKIGDSKKVQEFAAFMDKHPDIGNIIADVTQTGLNVGTAATLGEGIKAPAKNVVTKVTDTLAERGANADRVKIQEAISPKPTVKEARLAQSEGRLVKGKERTWLRGGTDDTVIPSAKVVKAAETIQRSIPDAAKLNESELHTALDAKIGETAQKLKPQMQATPVDQTITGKAFERWKRLKEEQANDAEFVDNQAGNTKLQDQFENRLKKLEWDITSPNGKFKAPTPKTLDDVWEVAKEYDQSVPNNVKQANAMSDAKLQYRKQMWLDNRAILRDILTNSENGLGEAKQAFSDMTDMYHAQEGIISKTKVDSGQVSKINQFLKDNPKVSTALGGVTIYEIAKKLGLPIP